MAHSSGLNTSSDYWHWCWSWEKRPGQSKVLPNTSPTSLLKVHDALNLLLEVVCSNLCSSNITFSLLSPDSHCLWYPLMVQLSKPWTSTEFNFQCQALSAWLSNTGATHIGCHCGPASRGEDIHMLEETGVYHKHFPYPPSSSLGQLKVEKSRSMQILCTKGMMLKISFDSLWPKNHFQHENYQ